MKRMYVAAVAAALIGCAATGVKVSEDQLQALRKGESTIDQVVARLGEPTSKIRTNDGKVTLYYTYAEAKVRAASYVPVVGLFAGGSDIRSSMAVLTFGRDGRLLELMTSESQYGTGVGSSAGAVAPGQVQQPRQ